MFHRHNIALSVTFCLIFVWIMVTVNTPRTMWAQTSGNTVYLPSVGPATAEPQATSAQGQPHDKSIYLPAIIQPQTTSVQADANPTVEPTAAPQFVNTGPPVDWWPPEGDSPGSGVPGVVGTGENLPPTISADQMPQDGIANRAVSIMSNEEVLIQVNPNVPDGVSAMQTGATHTQYSLDRWGNSDAVARGKSLLQAAAVFQNQHMMGWGANNPMPEPGVYNWSSLDARVQTMRETGATMVLTLCCAPGWMRPAGYEADWTYLEVAPDPARLQEFVNLTVAVAQRYPDVRYFQVWNEFKGMWSTSPGCTPSACGKNRWDYERYTTLYNAVYDGIKAVRPDALIGGPYIVMSTYSQPFSYTGTISGPYGYMDQRVLNAISYWLENKHGADFMVLDASSKNKDNVWLTNEYAQAQKFNDIVAWVRQQPSGGGNVAYPLGRMVCQCAKSGRRPQSL